MYVAPSIRSQMHQPVLVTAATGQAVSIADVKDTCKIDHNELDTLISDYIDAATAIIQTDAEIALMSSTWALYLDEFPDNEIELRRPPVTSVTSVTYVDSAGSTQTLSSSLYTTDIKHKPSRIHLLYNETWPFTYEQPNAVTVTFVAGATDQSGVPPVANLAIRMLVKSWIDECAQPGTVGVEFMEPYESFIRRLSWSGGL